MSATVSIVIPILDEQAQLPGLLASLAPFVREAEIVFVDGGSRDDGPARVQDAGFALRASPRGRAQQMNAGARATSGDALLFLHADSRLPLTAIASIRAAVCDPAVVMGWFDLGYPTSNRAYRWIATLGNLRCGLTGIVTGDHALWVRRSAFAAVGGYPDIALMEDIELSRRLKPLGRAVRFRERVLASPRKWEREGFLRTVALMWLVRGLYALGASPASMHRLYYGRDPGR